jgi:phenylalanyl-tRNA synthetase beta chain
MRAPLSWIREFTPVARPPAEIADALNQLGLEVDDIDAPGAGIEGVIVARILDVLPHPDADRLRLADVDTGDSQRRVVCGASNIAPGMAVPFAPVGARLPGDFEITKRTIRGVASDGMLCSARELGLGDDHEGILEIAGDAPVGAEVREVLGLDEIVFDLSITPNRPDAMGIAGVARELAAHFRLPFEVPVVEAAPSAPRLASAAGDVTVVVDAPDRCPRFVTRVAAVRYGESPAWMQRRLRAAGMRPINNIVDVTNYVMLERCRPLHAFDLRRLAGRGIVVRLAAGGERLTTLDGVERVLTGDDLLICDATRSAQSIAGIMGGRESEVDDTTTEILLEAAYFEPYGIARSSKRLGLRSEASARFERGVDPNGTASGADYAIALLAEVAGAQADPHAIDVYPVPVEPARVTVRTERVNALLGTQLDGATIRDLLEPLGIETQRSDGATIEVTCPTYRPDLVREVDLVEEVARRVGLQHITRTVAAAPPGSVGRLTQVQRERRLLADTLVGAGYVEAMTMPLLAPADLERAGVAAEGRGVVEVANPLRAEESVLRPCLRPGLLRAAAGNVARGEHDVALFELGTVFRPPRTGDLLPDERTALGAVLTGSLRRAPREPDRPAAVGDLVDVVHAIGTALRLEALDLIAAAPAGLHPGRSARIAVDGENVGVVGEVAAIVARAHGLERALVLELDTGRLHRAARRPPHVRAVSAYPPVHLDLAFVVADEVPAAAIAATLAEAGEPLVEEVRVFDEFRAPELGAGRRSLAYALRLRALDRTLTDREVAPLRQALIDAVEQRHGAALRS